MFNMRKSVAVWQHPQAGIDPLKVDSKYLLSLN